MSPNMVATAKGTATAGALCKVIGKKKDDYAKYEAALNGRAKISRKSVHYSQINKPTTPAGKNSAVKSKPAQKKGVPSTVSDLRMPGFKNLGRSCYLNALLQGMLGLPCLQHHLKQSTYAQNRQRVMGGQFCIMWALEKLYMKVLEVGKTSGGGFVSPNTIYNNISIIAPGFVKNNMEDVQELYVFLVNKMMDSSLEYKRMDVGSPGLAKCTAVQNMFEGAVIAETKCLSNKCRYCSKRREPFWELSVEMKNGLKSVEEAVKHFTKEEELGPDNMWLCVGCSQIVRCKRKLTVCKVPEVLAINLKRFSCDKGGKKVHKDTSFIKFKEGLSVDRADNEENAEYQLSSVIIHTGELANSGHYYAFVKRPDGGWVKADDLNVSKVSVTQVLKSSAYMLLYTRDYPKEKTKRRALRKTKAVYRTVAFAAAAAARAERRRKVVYRAVAFAAAAAARIKNQAKRKRKAAQRAAAANRLQRFVVKQGDRVRLSKRFKARKVRLELQKHTRKDLASAILVLPQPLTTIRDYSEREDFEAMVEAVSPSVAVARMRALAASRGVSLDEFAAFGPAKDREGEGPYDGRLDERLGVELARAVSEQEKTRWRAAAHVQNAWRRQVQRRIMHGRFYLRKMQLEEVRRHRRQRSVSIIQRAWRRRCLEAEVTSIVQKRASNWAERDAAARILQKLCRGMKEAQELRRSFVVRKFILEREAIIGLALRKEKEAAARLMAALALQDWWRRVRTRQRLAAAATRRRRVCAGLALLGFCVVIAAKHRGKQR